MLRRGRFHFSKLDMDEIRSLVAQGDFSRNAKLTIYIEYVPKTPA